MSSGTLARVTAKTAAEVCARFDIGEEARALLRPGLTPRQYVDVLAEKRSYPAAIRFLAHALPKREAVWWACSCARATAGPNPDPTAAAALQAAERWVVDPSEENRHAAMPAAQAAGLTTAAGSAALAAFVSGGSLAPSSVPPIPPADNLTPQIVGGAVVVAAVVKEPEKAFERFSAYLGKGIEIANGASRWVEKR